jgi:hypothetical protein
MVWLHGWEKGQTNSILGAGARGCSPKQFESTGSQVLAKICFTQPLTKTVSKHVAGNYGYSIYNNLKFAFEAAKNIRFSHSNLFWGASLAPIYLIFHYPST